MTISKKLLRQSIETTEFLISEYNKESEKFTQIASHNAKKLLKMQGRIEAFQ